MRLEEPAHRRGGPEPSRWGRRVAGPGRNRGTDAGGESGSARRHTGHRPTPTDSVFNRAIAGEFDVVLALYHDQGHIAIKVHNFQITTATLGVPMVRTSVDHGTAFDIAGKGIADATGMRAAIAAAQAIVAADLGGLS